MESPRKPHMPDCVRACVCVCCPSFSGVKQGLWSAEAEHFLLMFSSPEA